MHMSPQRALWEAVATVCIPIVLVWSVVLYLVRENAHPDEWPIYLIFIAIPLPLIYPIYKRHLKGEDQPKIRAPRYYFIASACFACLGSADVVLVFLDHLRKWDAASKLVVGISWLALGGDYLRRGLSARKQGALPM